MSSLAKPLNKNVEEEPELEEEQNENASDIESDTDSVKKGETGVSDTGEESDANDSDATVSEDEGAAEGEPSFASGVEKLSNASKTLLGKIQDVVSNAGASAGGEDLLSKLTKSSVKMPSSGRGRKKKGSTPAVTAGSTFDEDPLGGYGEDEGEGGEGGNDDEDDVHTRLKKFDREVRDNYLLKFHPESLVQNYDEIYNLSRVVRDDNRVIVDILHRTLPMLTKYEKARVLGQRAKQINDGATPFVKVPEGVIDGYLIAIKELAEKKIPFIIRRPLPNGGSEYWHLEDLEIIN
jgi:DNA-directed RNA polymerase subunit K/omega